MPRHVLCLSSIILTLISACQAPPKKQAKDFTPPTETEKDSKHVANTDKQTDPNIRKTQWHVAPKRIEDMAAFVRVQLAQAQKQQRQLVVYVGATWCEPCRRFHDAVASGKLDATFPHVRFLAFDADIHEQQIISAGYASKYIPLFSVPEATGRDNGNHIMGAIKGDGAIQHIVPRLQALLITEK